MISNNTELIQQASPYNNEPVFYCTHCLSLKIMVFNENENYCDACGNTEVASTSIKEWEKMYEEKYNEKFLNSKKDGNR